MPIMLIGLREHVTSLITDIVIDKLEEMASTFTEFCVPVRVHVCLLTTKQGKCCNIYCSVFLHCSSEESGWVTVRTEIELGDICTSVNP